MFVCASLEERLAEHKDDVKKNVKKQYTRATRKASQTELNKSAITDHMNKYNHLPDWENTKVLGKESNRKARWIKEAIQIQRHKKNMNRDMGNYDLPPVYHPLMKLMCETRPNKFGKKSAASTQSTV